MLVHEYLLSSAEKLPDKPAIIYGKVEVTYKELSQTSLTIGSWLLKQNLEQGFRAVILTDDPFEYIASYFGILMAGGIAIGSNIQTSATALTDILTDSKASIILTGRKYEKFLDAGLQNSPSVIWAISSGGMNFTPAKAKSISFDEIIRDNTSLDRSSLPYQSSCQPAQIIYTSGTTGKPKGVVLRHRNLIANTESIISYLKLTEDDSVMAVLPFFYSYGNSVLLTHIGVGGTLVVNQNFMYPNVILQQMVDYNVTGFSGVPSTFALLLNRSAIASFSFPKLRYLTQAGAAMSPRLATRLHDIFPGVEIYIMYGQTEASARLAYLPPGDVKAKPGSIGLPIPGVELQLLDKKGCRVAQGETGEIVARGDNIMAGYWKQTEATAKVLRSQGLWTGDLARYDKDGYLYIVSRKSDIIKSGSHRIGPKEIEDTLTEHTGVHETAVIGIPDEILDERIRACVVLNDGIGCTAKELQKHCRKILPAYKVPHEVVFYDELPKTSTGKIKKSSLKPDEK